MRIILLHALLLLLSAAFIIIIDCAHEHEEDHRFHDCGLSDPGYEVVYEAMKDEIELFGRPGSKLSHSDLSELVAKLASDQHKDRQIGHYGTAPAKSNPGLGRKDRTLQG
jgi:hypothetical protein